MYMSIKLRNVIYNKKLLSAYADILGSKLHTYKQSVKHNCHNKGTIIHIFMSITCNIQ